MHIDHSVTLLTLSCVCNIATKYSAPILYYDQERYEYEDSLIRGERPRSRSEKSDNNYPQENPHLIRVQPLNFRLPNIPTQPPEFANPKVLNISARLDSTVVLPCRVTNLGIVSVSWLRAPQLTVLSSGLGQRELHWQYLIFQLTQSFSLGFSLWKWPFNQRISVLNVLYSIESIFSKYTYSILLSVEQYW